MQSTADTLNELINQLCPFEKPKNIVPTGGGAKSDLWFKIKSQKTGCIFSKINCSEPATMGAAILASESIY
jgi:sugar (pentulose or hexulose) kinase